MASACMCIPTLARSACSGSVKVHSQMAIWDLRTSSRTSQGPGAQSPRKLTRGTSMTRVISSPRSRSSLSFSCGMPLNSSLSLDRFSTIT